MKYFFFFSCSSNCICAILHNFISHIYIFFFSQRQAKKDREDFFFPSGDRFEREGERVKERRKIMGQNAILKFNYKHCRIEILPLHNLITYITIFPVFFLFFSWWCRFLCGAFRGFVNFTNCWCKCILPHTTWKEPWKCATIEWIFFFFASTT